ncbi:hypothetical protein AB4Z54_27070, partial [Streptomyces sp. MCAF7]
MALVAVDPHDLDRMFEYGNGLGCSAPFVKHGAQVAQGERQMVDLGGFRHGQSAAYGDALPHGGHGLLARTPPPQRQAVVDQRHALGLKHVRHMHGNRLLSGLTTSRIGALSPVSDVQFDHKFGSDSIACDRSSPLLGPVPRLRAGGLGHVPGPPGPW